MNIIIETRNFEKLHTEELKVKCPACLDQLWESQWVRRSITRADMAQAEELQALGDKIAQSADVTVVLASGQMAKLLRAGISAAEPVEEKSKVIVFGDTFSPSAYASLLHSLEGKSFTLLAISEAEESLQLRGAYSVLKQQLISSCGKEQAADRIFAIAGKESKFLTAEAAAEDYPLLSYPEIPAAYGAGTSALLLALAIKGVNLELYLSGFYDMLASPSWDLDGVDYAVGRAAYRKACGKDSGAGEELLLVWQNQLVDFGAWYGSCRRMPSQSANVELESAFQTLLLVEKDSLDIMMPYFDGCNEDGSLNLLMAEEANRHFEKTACGVKVSLTHMDDYNLGQLFAFMQLSKGITDLLVIAQ